MTNAVQKRTKQQLGVLSIKKQVNPIPVIFVQTRNVKTGATFTTNTPSLFMDLEQRVKIADLIEIIINHPPPKLDI